MGCVGSLVRIQSARQLVRSRTPNFFLRIKKRLAGVFFILQQGIYLINYYQRGEPRRSLTILTLFGAPLQWRHFTLLTDEQ